MSLNPIDDNAREWAEEWIERMEPTDLVAQMLMPNIRGGDSGIADLVAFMADHALGGVFVGRGDRETLRRHIRQLQDASRLPLVVAADLERGAGGIVEGAVQFPEPLALAAADDEDLAYQMGKAAAIEGRGVGIHWTFAPVVDVNLNPDNPITCNRSLGDDPERVARLAAAIIRGMQEHGLAACAKHFPGDGVDDLDQHVVTSVNSLAMSDWHKIFGRTFMAAFEAGCMSTMIGHIALPDWDDTHDDRGALCPASVSRRIVTGLLRERLGFKGLIVTDDMTMGGVSGYMKRADRVVACIQAGCDMLLFPHLPDDYRTLLDALDAGVLSLDRVTEAARSVLIMKVRLGLHTDRIEGPAPTDEQKTEFAAAAACVAEKALCLVRDVDGILPLTLPSGARVATITLSVADHAVPEIDNDLKQRGFHVDHFQNPSDCTLSERLMQYDAIFLNFVFCAEWGVQSVRSIGPHNRIFLGGFHREHPCVVCTSFGSPYHLRQLHALPTMLNVFSRTPENQHAAVKAWFGELPMTAISPVEENDER